MIGMLLGILGHRRHIWTLCATSALSAVLQGVALALSIPALRELLRHDPGAATKWLLALLVVVLAYWVTYAIAENVGSSMQPPLRGRLFDLLSEKIVELPLGWFDGTRAGQLTALISRAGSTTQMAVAAILAMSGAVLPPLVVIVGLAVFAWPIALTVAVVAPLVLGLQVATSAPTARSEAKEAAAEAEASSRIIEFTHTQQPLRASGREDKGLGPLEHALRERHTAARQHILRTALLLKVSALAVYLGYVAVLVVSLLVASHTSMDRPTLVAAMALGIWTLRPISELPGAVLVWQATRRSLQAVKDVLDQPALSEPAADGVPVPGAPAVRLTQVAFAYGDTTPAIQDVDLEVPVGSLTALVGRSGSGKSTLLHLISRFWDVTSGRVQIDGVDVRDMSTATLMSKISIVPQDVYLFDDTIEANIQVGRPDASAEELAHACRRAQVNEIIHRLPDGWDTRVGAGGALLSGGERQRVAIARALLKDAPLVLLDEAASALDAHNDAAITEALAELRDDRTVIVVAHRLETLTHADQVIVLDGGRVVEAGSHASLLAADGHFAALWRERRRAKGWRLTS